MAEPIHIEIITSEQMILCQSECGTDWSQAETQARTRNDLKKRFGNQVSVNFTFGSDRCVEIKNDNKYPVLLVNGQIRLSGQFDIRQVIDTIETQMEIGAPVQ